MIEGHKFAIVLEFLFILFVFLQIMEVVGVHVEFNYMFSVPI